MSQLDLLLLGCFVTSLLFARPNNTFASNVGKFSLGLTVVLLLDRPNYKLMNALKKVTHETSGNLQLTLLTLGVGIFIIGFITKVITEKNRSESKEKDNK